MFHSTFLLTSHFAVDKYQRREYSTQLPCFHLFHLAAMQYLVVFLVAAGPTTINVSPQPDIGGNQGSLMLDGTFAGLDQSFTTGGVLIASQVNLPTTGGHRLPVNGAGLPVVGGDFIASNADLSFPTLSSGDPLATNEHSLTTDGGLYADETQHLVQNGVKQYFDRWVSECGDWPCFPDRGNNRMIWAWGDAKIICRI